MEAFDSFKPKCRLFCLMTYQLKIQISSQISNGYDSSPQKPLEDRVIACKNGGLNLQGKQWSLQRERERTAVLEAAGLNKHKINSMHQYSKVGRWVCQSTSAVFLITTSSNQDHRGAIHPDQQVLPNTQKLRCNQYPLFVRRQGKLEDKRPVVHTSAWLTVFGLLSF